MPGEYVAVVSDRTLVKGLKTLDDRALCDPITVLPVAEAFTREWETDAHLCLYLTTEWRIGEPFYRLNKPFLSALRLASAKAGEPEDVHGFYIAMDLDTKGHLPWTPETFNEFVLLLASLRGTAVGEVLALALASYSTRRGWRWVFRLSRGVPADDLEPLIRGLLKFFRDGGLPVDQAEVLATWNCTFRLPRVMRDGQKTSEDPFFFCEIHLERRLDPSTIVPDGHADPSSAYYDGDGVMPTQEEAMNLLHYLGARGNLCDRPFYKEMKSLFRGREYHATCFDASHPFPDGKNEPRHVTMRRWTMSAAGFAARIHEEEVNGETVAISEKHLFALFEPAASQVDQIDPGRNFRWDTWRLCCGAWAQAVAEVVQKEKLRAQKEEEHKEIKTIAEVKSRTGVLALYPFLEALDNTARDAWLNRRRILKEKRRSAYYVMRQDGTYPSEPVDEAGLIPQIIQHGMQGIISVVKQTKSGDRPVRVADLAVDGFITNISSVEYRPEIAGGYILNPEDVESPRLVVPSFRRNPKLVPTFHPGVDLWIQNFAQQQYDDFCYHLGCFPAWDRGQVAAMVLTHGPGSGKGMLCQALVEILENYRLHEAATSGDFVMQFNDCLRRTPFVILNEGVQDGKHEDPADMFRRIITGDSFRVDGKNRDPLSHRFNFRCVIAANNDKILDRIGANRDLSPDDRAALAIRLKEYVPEDRNKAARFLASMGGRAWTKGWIEDDDGQSQFILAKHILWLHEKYGKHAVPTGTGRLLVEGDVKQGAIQRLRNRGGSTPIVVETILRMLDTQGVPLKSIHIENNRLYVTVSGIMEFWRNNLTKGSKDQLTPKRVTSSLEGLVLEGGKGYYNFGLSDQQKAARKEGNGKERGMLWYEIDVVNLAAEGDRLGISSLKLDEILQARLNNIVGEAPSAPAGLITPFPGNGVQ